jgi:hypothetical protein
VVEIERFKDMGNHLAIVTLFLWATPLQYMGDAVAFPRHCPGNGGNAAKLRAEGSIRALQHSRHCPGNGALPGLLPGPLPGRFRAIARAIAQPIARAFSDFPFLARVIQSGGNGAMEYMQSISPIHRGKAVSMGEKAGRDWKPN